MESISCPGDKGETQIMSSQSFKQKYIQGLLDTNAFIVRSIKEEPFVKRNGQKSYMFLDHSRVATSPTAYKSFIDVIQALVLDVFGENEFVLCNVDSKISGQMVGSVAYNLGKPQIIYKSKELTAIEKGTQSQLTGNYNWNFSAAILDDGVTGGDGTAKKVADLIADAFPNINRIEIFTGFIRYPMRKHTYETHYVLTFEELIDIMWDKLNEDQRKAIEKERNSNEL